MFKGNGTVKEVGTREGVFFVGNPCPPRRIVAVVRRVVRFYLRHTIPRHRGMHNVDHRWLGWSVASSALVGLGQFLKQLEEDGVARRRGYES